MKLRLTRTLPFCLWMGLFLSLAACSFGESMKTAENAVQQFHSRYNARQYHDMYMDADQMFRESGSEASLAELLDAIHRKLGNVEGATQNDREANWNSSTGTRVALSYRVKFSQGEGTEEFLWQAKGKAAKLLAYNINSLDLIRK